MAGEISFGDWLRKQRRALDLSQQAFADRVGCAAITLRRIESGSLKPSRELALLLLEKAGISETERSGWVAFARGLSGFPPSAPLASDKTKTNLPAPLTTFIGREKEQSQVSGLLRKHRLVTLTGPGGVGKTRLAIRVGEQQLSEQADGVWLVELAPLLDPQLVPRSTAQAVGLREESQRPVIDMLSDYLAEKQILLLLDNCEHLLEACAQLADTLLRRCPGLTLLATSREAFGILGEAVYPVPSLALPDAQKLLGRWRAYESIRLFEERAQLIRMDFSLTLENAASVTDICSRLDGIPLAIELAAARVGAFSTEHIAARLGESFDLLTTGNRAALPRHQTLRAAIDWSYDLLSGDEQTLFWRLSVFVGGWTLEAAESVCSDSHPKAESIPGLLAQLLNKSLVTIHDVEGKPRYSMLETLRQYSNEKAVADEESDRLRDKHLEYFLNLAETAEPHLIRPEQLEWLARLDADYENLRGALRWAQNKASAEASLRLCAALGRYWAIHSSLIEGSAWLQEALSKPVDHSSSVEIAAYVKALYHDAHLADAMDDAERMLASAELSYTLAKESLTGLEAVITKFYFGLALQRNGDHREAAALLQESLDEFRALNDPYWEAQCYYWFSYLLVEFGRLTLPELLSQKVKFARVAGERLLLATSLSDSAWYLSKDIEDAQRLAEEADVLFKQVGSGFNTSHALLAAVEWFKGDYEKAKQIYMEAAEHGRVIGEKFIRSDRIASLGLIEMEQGHYVRAQDYLEQALATSQELDSQNAIAWRLSDLGKLFFLRGELERAKEAIRGSVVAARNLAPFLKLHPLLLILSTMYAQDPERSARILGALDAFFQREGQALFAPFALKQYHDRAASHARQALGGAAFEQAFVEGRTMSLDGALDLVLQALEEM